MHMITTQEQDGLNYGMLFWVIDFDGGNIKQLCFQYHWANAAIANNWSE